MATACNFFEEIWARLKPMIYRCIQDRMAFHLSGGSGGHPEQGRACLKMGKEKFDALIDDFGDSWKYTPSIAKS